MGIASSVIRRFGGTVAGIENPFDSSCQGPWVISECEGGTAHPSHAPLIGSGPDSRECRSGLTVAQACDRAEGRVDGTLTGSFRADVANTRASAGATTPRAARAPSPRGQAAAVGSGAGPPRPAPPADAAGHRGLEPRPARRGGAGALPAPGRLPRGRGRRIPAGGGRG